MNGLKLIAAGICGSALTLGLTVFAQAPRQRVTECPTPSVLYSIEGAISSLGEKVDRIHPDLDRIATAIDRIETEQRQTRDETTGIRVTLQGLESNLLDIELRQRYR